MCVEVIVSYIIVVFFETQCIWNAVLICQNYYKWSPKTIKIGNFTSLKYALYFRIILQTLDIEWIIFQSHMQNLVKISKELQT